MTYDLFGEIPVLESEIVLWVAAVAPRWLTPARSFNGYVRGYAVIDKIRAAKLSGHFDSITARAAPAYHVRLPVDLL